MTLQSWKDEFYPVLDYEFSRLDAIRHSLNKWIGLRKNNLDKHRLVFEFGSIVEYDGDYNVIDKFTLGTDNCSLCIKYRTTEKGHHCDICPLYILREETPCDNEIYGDTGYIEKLSPWHSMICSSHNPEPMIEWLEKIVEFEIDNPEEEDE